MRLLTTKNAKTIKGEKYGWLTGILYLTPGDLSGHEVCPWRTAGCSASCLNTAGRGQWDTVQRSRLNKTRWLFEDRPGFIAQLCDDIEALIRKARRSGMRPAVRLNGTSDIPWEQRKWGSVPQRFPAIRVYDYSKSWSRVLNCRASNYYLTFSRTERRANWRRCLQVLEAGRNVAVVFDKPPFPSEYLGYPVVDGDAHDLRFKDPRPCIVGLKAKGPAVRDRSGFVVRTT